MRVGLLLGLLLIGGGIFAATGQAKYKTSREVLQIGELKASVKEERALPSWVGYLAIGAGVLVLLGSRRRRN